MKAKKAYQESVNNQIYNVMLTNLLLTCYVLHEHFGFGAKRLDSYIQAIVEEAEHFDDMARDGILDLRTADERRKYQQQFREILQTTAKVFLSEDCYNAIFVGRSPTRSEVQVKVKNEERKFAVSISEASKMQTMAQAFGDFLKDKEVHKNV